METRVSINNNGELVAEPKGTQLSLDLERIMRPCELENNYLYNLEFITNPDLNSNDTIKISKNRDNYVVSLPKDGLYVYYRIVVLDETAIPENYKDLYYDSTKGVLIFNKKEVKDIAELVPQLSISSGNIYYEEIPVISIYNLRNCVLKTEEDAICHCNSNINTTNCNKDVSKQMKNFLFISLYVLESLICQNRYAEAAEILERVSACNSICNSSMYNKRECGCNG